MKRIRSSIVTMVLVLAMLTILVPSPAYACSCAQSQNVEAELGRSEAVFAGRVLEVKEQRYVNGSMTKAVLFEISRTWKGGPESQIIVYTGSGGGDCGFQFEAGKEYLVYAHPSSMYANRELLVTILCDRTNELKHAGEDLAVLGEGKPPTKPVNLKGELHRELFYWLMILIGVTGIGTAVFLFRRKARS